MVEIDTSVPNNLSIIVAVAQNYAIGKDKDLLWHISDDLKHFKAITSGHPVIMGRNTWNSLPRRPLPKRRNIVLTHSVDFQPESVEVAHSLAEVFALVRDEEQAFIIGGAEIYRQFLPWVQTLHVTWVHRDFEADTFFPVIDNSLFFKAQESETFLDPETGLSYSYVEYHRIPSPTTVCLP